MKLPYNKGRKETEEQWMMTDKLKRIEKSLMVEVPDENDEVFRALKDR